MVRPDEDEGHRDQEEEREEKKKKEEKKSRWKKIPTLRSKRSLKMQNPEGKNEKGEIAR